MLETIINSKYYIHCWLAKSSLASLTAKMTMLFGMYFQVAKYWWQVNVFKLYLLFNGINCEKYYHYTRLKQTPQGLCQIDAINESLKLCKKLQRRRVKFGFAQWLALPRCVQGGVIGVSTKPTLLYDSISPLSFLFLNKKEIFVVYMKVNGEKRLHIQCCVHLPSTLIL